MIVGKDEAEGQGTRNVWVGSAGYLYVRTAIYSPLVPGNWDWKTYPVDRSTGLYSKVGFMTPMEENLGLRRSWDEMRVI